MNRYRLTPQAENDLFEIWRYIARDNLPAAGLVEAAIFAACAFVASVPLCGHTREDITTLPVRFWTVQPYQRYMIVYDPVSRPVQVIRILHGARDISSLLEQGAGP